jgi:hypothetical protein
MTGLKEGQRMKYQKDGRIYRITKITRDFAVLQALDDSTQVLTGIFSLDFLFEKVPPADSRESRSFRRQTHAAVSERRGKEGTA